MYALKKQPKREVSYEVETITPAIAAKLLEANTNNRNLSKALVKFFQKQIEKDNWQINGESIKIANDGTLLDGQHRLTAIVAAGKPVSLLVVRGLSTESFKTIDTGRTRTMGDHLHIDGYSSTNLLAAAIRVAMKFNPKTGAYEPSSDRISPTELLSWLYKHKSMPDALNFCSQLKGVTSISTVAGVYYICNLIDPEAASTFFTGVVTGEKLSARNPALLLRNRLIAIRKDGRAGAQYQKTVVALIVHAFNCYRNNKQLTKLVYAGGDIVLDGLKGAIRQ